MTRTIYIFLSAGVALVLSSLAHEVMAGHAAGVIAGTELAPYQYRPLFTLFFYPLMTLIGTWPAAWLFWTVALSAFTLAIDAVCCAFGVKAGQLWALVALIAAAVMVYLQPAGGMWSIIEAVLFALALLLMLRGRVWWLYPLVIIAALNRETAIFIPALALLVLRDWRHVIGLLVVWAAVYGGLRLYFGPVPVDLSLAEIWAINTGRGLLPFLLGLPLFGWLFWYAGKGWKVAPEPLRWAALVIPLYLALVAVFGVWYEWRLILPLFPLLIPLAGLNEAEYFNN